MLYAGSWVSLLLLFIFCKEQIQPGKRRFFVTVLAGFTVFLGGLSWEGFGLFVLIILALELWKFCTTDAEHHFKEYLIWTFTFVPALYLISPIYQRGFGFSTHVSALMLLPSLTVFVLLGTRHLLLKYVEYLRPHARKLAWGLTFLAIVAGAGYISFYAGTFETTAPMFRGNLLLQNVSELADPHFRYWPGRYGAIFILGSIGLIVSCLYLWKWKGFPLASSLMLFTATTFFRWPVSKLIGESACDMLFFISLGLAVVCLAIASRRKETEENENVLLAMLVWFLLWVAFARSGKRYDFFIGIPLAFGTAWFLWLLPIHLIQKLKDLKILYPHGIREKGFAAVFAIVLLIPILFWNPLGGHANRAVHAAARMKRPIPGEGSLAQTFKWIKNTLPQNAVIAANWPHGTQLNVLSSVNTIIDSDHFILHWIHLFYRHVFCAEDKYEALTFLKTHNATHLMLTEREVIGRAHAYSLIGSDTNDDRHFTFYPLKQIETPIGAPYQLRPRRDETPIVFVNLVPKMPIQEQGNHASSTAEAQQKLIVIVHLRTHHNISKEISINTDKNSLQAVEIGNGGIILFFDAHAILQYAYYVPSLGWNSLAVKLFLRGEYNDVFIPTYPTGEEATGYVKVWKINYPSYIKADSKYLATEPAQSTAPSGHTHEHPHDSAHPHGH